MHNFRHSGRRVRIIAAVLAALLLLYGIGVLLAKPAPSHEWYAQGTHRPLVIAHQGGEGLRPSSTMLAYDHAVELGADVLEGDVHTTRDGHLVLIHDEEVDRTTNGTGEVDDMTLAQVQALDAGYYWTEDGETYPYRGQGLTIITVRELFEKYPDYLYVLEIKKTDLPTAEPMCDLVKEMGMQDKVLIASVYQDMMDTFRSACPDVTTSATQDEATTFFAMSTLLLAPLYSPSMTALQVPEYSEVRGVNLHVITPRFVRAAHNRGIDVHPWTINTAADMQRMIAIGADGIITDRPDLLLDLLGSE
jgi:glycerophosphoryl diester phosphodiesterase